MIPALANHLLQSTIFAAVAGILTLLLRNNHARTRYWLWLAASMKFLIPFSLFVEIGHRLSWSTATVIAQPGVAFVMNEISQPFVTPGFIVNTPVSAPSIVPTLLLMAWICGTAAVLIFWFVRWRRVAAILRTGMPIREGRELCALRRLDAKVDLISSRARIEPGVFGILHPILSLPAGIAEHLDDAHLNAIFAHELCHIRRRDNLTAALHMLVEAIFWFHPLVWWMGSKLVEERERACDEEVVRLGCEPELYAETILQICKLYLATPLVCAAGISGADLSKRIETIMNNALLRNLSVTKKTLLVTVAALALIAPIAAGILGAAPARTQSPKAAAVAAPAQPLLAQATPAPVLKPRPAAPPQPPSTPPPPLAFEVASIREKPQPWRVLFGYTASGPRLTLEGYTPAGMISEAYALKNYRVIVADSFRLLANTYYDVAAKAEGDGTPTRGEFRQMVQVMLADRFGLKVHREMRDMPVYVMVVGKNGPKFKESDPEAPASSYGGVNGRNQYVKLSEATMDSLADGIMNGQWPDRPVVNETGLTGKYDIRLEATPQFRMASNPQPDDLTVFTAIQEQLGLRLDAQTRPMEVLVIDRIEKPSAN